MPPQTTLSIFQLVTLTYAFFALVLDFFLAFRACAFEFASSSARASFARYVSRSAFIFLDGTSGSLAAISASLSASTLPGRPPCPLIQKN